MLDFLFSYINRRRWFVVGIFTILTLLFAALSFKLNFSDDLVELLPKNHPDVEDYRLAIEHFNPLDVLTLTLSYQDSAQHNLDGLAGYGDDLFSYLETSGLFKRITYAFDHEQAASVMLRMYEHRAALFSKDDAELLETKLNKTQLEQNLSKWFEFLATNPAPFLAQAFYQDPLNFSSGLLKRLQKLQSYSDQFHIYRDRLFSKDQTHLIMIAQPLRPASDQKFSKQLVKLMDDYAKKLSAQNIQLSYISGHRFSEKNAREIRDDVELASTISLVGILLLAISTFRRRYLPLLTIVPLLFGTAFAFAMMYMLDGQMNLISIACGSILFGVAVDYGIHILYHLDQSDTINPNSILASMRGLMKPITMSALTTVCAFLCLQISVMPVYREFSWFSVFGLLASLLAAIFFLPLLVPRGRSHPPKAWVDLKRLYEPSVSLLSRFPKALTGFIVTLSVLSIAGLPKLSFDGDLQHLYASSSEIDHDLKTVNSALGDALSTSSVMTRGANLEKALEANEVVADLLEHESSEDLASYSSVASFLPSQVAQEANLKRWRSFWIPARISQLKKDLSQLKGPLQLKPAMVEHILGLIKNDYKTISLGDYKDSSIYPFLQNHIAETENEAFILSTLKLSHPEALSSIRLKINQKDPHAILINARGFVSSILSMIYSEMQRIGILCVVSVVVVLALFYGIRSAIPMVLPLLLSMVWTFGIQGLLGIPINLLNCVVSLFIFGLVIDYSVFLYSALLLEEEDSEQLATSFASIFMSALTTIIGVGALAVAKHPALQSIGVTILIGISCGLSAITLVFVLIRTKKRPYLSTATK